jgi:hypothetical protein
VETIRNRQSSNSSFQAAQRTVALRSLGPIPIVDVSMMPIIATSAFMHSCENSLSLLFVVVHVVDIKIAISLSKSLHRPVVVHIQL